MHFGYAQCKQKGFTSLILLIGLVLTLGIAGGAYYFSKSQISKPTNPSVVSQTPQSTQTPSNQPNKYINEQAGFSIAFPHGWRIPESVYKNTPQPKGTEVGLGWGLQWSKDNSDNRTPLLIVISKENAIQEANLDQYAKGGCGWITQPNKTLKVKDFSVDSRKARYWENIRPNDKLGHNVYYACIAVSGNPGFQITWHDSQIQKSSDLDQILSTFKFTQ